MCCTARSTSHHKPKYLTISLSVLLFQLLPHFTSFTLTNRQPLPQSPSYKQAEHTILDVTITLVQYTALVNILKSAYRLRYIMHLQRHVSLAVIHEAGADHAVQALENLELAGDLQLGVALLRHEGHLHGLRKRTWKEK